eukprot:gnl/MRDRNA2_/MRDRNA2_88654_c0_seq1.p1 gnl/MRDRNA2_/MRDRNA2_88654_c0~~gnl/MRDRNA2_/MRDRNA2_88654_c0_seq1.p1  ORF type:complete len:237 (+),score=72.94 gnl/MRDRNA2_/MRDRNA2_88654_c0_seq1:92-802(+)
MDLQRLLSFIILLNAAEGTAPGALKLDNYTFDKAMSLPGFSILVKFDQSYAYGEKEDEFKTLCKLAHKVPEFFIAEVPVQEWGDKENDDLRERFKLKKDDFPVYLFFNEKNKEGLKYDGSVKAGDIAAWIRRQGIKMPAIGTIAELDTIAKKFMKDKGKDTISEAKALVEKEYKEDKKGPMYIKIMEKVTEKGDDYITTEIKRVEKLLAGKVVEEKAKELNDKLKILAIFGEKSEL